MKFYLLPISTRRTLLYCSKALSPAITTTPTYLDKGTARAAALWAKWEEKESGWQKHVVNWGNTALKRIPFEEWGLKSIPPLSARRKKEEMNDGDKQVEVVFPSSVFKEGKVLEELKRMGMERQGLHMSRLRWCVIGMPISAPFMLVPV